MHVCPIWFRIYFFKQGECIARVYIWIIIFSLSVSPSPYIGNLAVTSTNGLLPPWKGMLVEMWLTCMLVLTIWGATDKKRRAVHMSSIPIGMAVAMCTMAGVSLK